jgi:putative transposase
MARAGPKGVGGRPKRRRARPDLISTDPVDRQFARDGVNELWVTDITEHPTREGKVYCTVVLDVCSRRVVGWSIDSSPTAALVTNALGMAIENRRPPAGTIIHCDHGVQGGFNESSQHLMITEVSDGAAAAAGGSGSAPGDAVTGTTDPGQAR